MNAVQFVGAGPGAADLLTVRATRLLATADTVLYPGSYLDPNVLESCSPTAELIDTQNLNLDEIVGRIVEAQRA
jgi:precorrin-4/cobalt-precorrin-4 C11-methyltransferase